MAIAETGVTIFCSVASVELISQSAEGCQLTEALMCESWYCTVLMNLHRTVIMFVMIIINANNIIINVADSEKHQ